MRKIMVLFIVMLLALQAAGAVDHSMESKEVIGTTIRDSSERGVTFYWKYIEGFGTRSVKVWMENKRPDKLRITCTITVYQNGSYVDSWECDVTLEGYETKTPNDHFHLERYPDTWVDEIEISDITYWEMDY